MRLGEKVGYEWDIETLTIDGFDDVEDHNHSNRLNEFGTDIFPLAHNERLVLVRDVYTDSQGVIDREWAYVENGKLPEQFSDAYDVLGSRVPKRFHNELKLHNK